MESEVEPRLGFTISPQEDRWAGGFLPSSGPSLYVCVWIGGCFKHVRLGDPLLSPAAQRSSPGKEGTQVSQWHLLQPPPVTIPPPAEKPPAVGLKLLRVRFYWDP